MTFSNVSFGDVTDNFDKKRIPLSAAQREKRQGKYRYYGAQGVIDLVDDYIFDGTYLLIAEDGENLKSKKSNIAQLASGKFWVNNHAHVIQCKKGYDIRYGQIVRDILKEKINPILFDECYVAVQESLIPDWYNKEIGQSKARKALADALQKYSSMERPMAKTVSKLIIDDIVDAITKELEKNQD